MRWLVRIALICLRKSNQWSSRVRQRQTPTLTLWQQVSVCAEMSPIPLPCPAERGPWFCGRWASRWLQVCWCRHSSWRWVGPGYMGPTASSWGWDTCSGRSAEEGAKINMKGVRWQNRHSFGTRQTSTYTRKPPIRCFIYDDGKNLKTFGLISMVQNYYRYILCWQTMRQKLKSHFGFFDLY